MTVTKNHNPDLLLYNVSFCDYKIIYRSNPKRREGDPGG